ncbi:hypothetical protein GE21DRAFT_7787 [Neurospora crassa]|uniref:Molybdate transporter 1 n=2 Tax=Neurospora crassa TaxID=5141 RepID=MOT1_NEUCR|nr:hypothetical protein NCU01356 [Neurospora crassa OR74A]Q1K6N8.1 RecName: Full=Molybdate transporter 1; AltName: Full=NcMOT-1; AltName: Full=Vacuolar molybdate exporter 1 [Neurospora crassa OR74A]EAA31472.1 hypothetical protein NCU01356 [Neurospora crassa OR74A]KHE80804.1 hypothetical protein GE21DRAFT_7787 [Neurospora crassa]CAB88650.1 conserved hypothetical protein [Neurospora crassa]|eukprot:XP_960708.1 hypothetical protein NCU01356 [Neurospora crassa OR74A]
MFFTKPRLHRIITHNLHHLLSPHLLLSEISGSLGDLGTLLPLLLALSLQGSIDLPSTLLFSGLFNILTGLVFGVPLPVQPMKAIAAASLQENADLETTVAAGAWVGFAVLLLGGTGGLKRVMRWVPGAVVRGVQVGAGMSLVVAAGGGMVRPLGWLWTPEENENGHGGLGEWLDSRALAVLAFGGLVVGLGQQQQQQQQSGEKPQERRKKRSKMPVQVPYALVLFLVGIMFAVVRVSLSKDSPQSPPPPPHDQPTNSAPPWTWIWNPLNHIHPKVFRSLLNPQALSMAIAQLPLTTLNSIIAASALASDLFPPDSYPQLYADDESSDSPLSPSPSASSSSLSSAPPQTPSAETPKPLSSPTSAEEGPVPLTPLSLSISAMNLLSAPFGCMPLCHGSGGLAAQHRFGARSGTSIILLGLTKFLLGLFFPGPGLLGLLGKFPKAFLGVMVLGAGVELARVGVRNVEGEEQDRMVMLMTAGTILAFKNDGVGFLAGMGCYGGFRVAAWLGGGTEKGRGGEQGLLGEEEEEEEQGRVDEESPLLR